MDRIGSLISVLVLGFIWFARFLAILTAAGGIIYFADYWLEPETVEKASVLSVTTRGDLFFSHRVTRIWLDSKEGCERNGGTYIYTSDSPVCRIQIAVSDTFANTIEGGDKLRLRLSPLFGHGLRAVEISTGTEDDHTPIWTNGFYIFLFASPSLIVWRNMKGKNQSQKAKRALSSVCCSLFGILLIYFSIYFVRFNIFTFIF